MRDRPIEHEVVAVPAPQQRADGQTRGLTQDVPAGHVDARLDVGMPLGGVSPDQSRQQVEPRFVLENQHPVLAPCPLAQFGPDRRTPVLDGLFVSLDGPPNRHLGGPLQFLQEPANVPLVVADAEFLFDNLGNTATSPDLAAEAISLRPVPEELGDQALLRVGELGRAAWDGLRAQHLGAASADASEPK